MYAHICIELVYESHYLTIVLILTNLFLRMFTGACTIRFHLDTFRGARRGQKVNVRTCFVGRGEQLWSVTHDTFKRVLKVRGAPHHPLNEFLTSLTYREVYHE